jgi:tyrosinase
MGDTRRKFLKTSGSAVSATILGSLLLDVDCAAPSPVLVRRNVASMDPSDPVLVSYRKAIGAMQARPATDPTSWTYQAAIHGTLSSLAQPSWNTCEHGTDFFWSWHRMYLYWFERIVQKACGDHCWVLPYWNWAPGSDLQLPAPFRDTASELYTVNRDPAINSGAGSLNALAVSVISSFTFTNFVDANGSIQSPHGSVHIEVGGWMQDIASAAQDPIFYVHHANVDRLWNLWLAQGGGRTDPVFDATWAGQQYTFFNENGSAVKMTACQILRAAQQLKYVYEGEPPQVLQYCQRRPPWPYWAFEAVVLIRLPGPPVELKGEPVSVTIPLKEIAGRIAPALESKTDTILLTLDDVEAETQPGVAWAVFVGLPARADVDPKSPSFVGTLALFGSGVRSDRHHGYKAARFVYSLNRALQAALKVSDESAVVTFVPLGIVIDGKPSQPDVKASARIGKMTLSVETGKEAR